MKTLESRFFEKVDMNASGGCWEWLSVLTHNGYGRFWMTKGTKVAHRISYEMKKGPIGSGLQTDHLCRNRKCVNPAHLEVVTLQENVRRGMSVQNVNRMKTHCKKGHSYSGVNLFIDAAGGRICRECRRKYIREYMRAYKPRKTVRLNRRIN